jgi:type II secretory pathway predicted ATPase ExeA
MTQFNGHHIKNFNQRCKNLTGDRVIFSVKECRDLQGEILELLVRLQELESDNSRLKMQASEISIELEGGKF